MINVKWAMYLSLNLHTTGWENLHEEKKETSKQCIMHVWWNYISNVKFTSVLKVQFYFVKKKNY